MKNQNEKQVAHLQLSKSSSTEQLKQYFMGIVAMNESNEEFPINLDDIWPIAYNRRQEAVRALTDESSGFMQDLDYQFLRKNAQNYEGHTPGRPVIEYFLSVSCAEYLIVRKCRPAFEVYRQVFHKVVSGGVSLFGLGKYYTLNEYCQMFGKSPNSFYGLMANYREEFAMIGRTYYISKALCKMLEMRNNVERMRTAIKEKSFKNELGFQFDE